MRPHPRRTLRHITAIGGAVALTLAIAAPSVASAPAEATATLGAPVPYLIENVHAAGKVLEIGADDAQSTGPSDAPWLAAAAIFSKEADAASLRAQAVLAYPVTGAADTYVFANDDGDVLARKANDDPWARYVEISDLTVAEAATDPGAQWRAVDAGGGAVYLHNVRPYTNGATAALDMYNWATADGAEIQTYDAGSAAVQKWYLRSLDATVAPHTGRTDLGVAPTLPSSLVASYSWGLSHTLTAIAWTDPGAGAWQAEGTVRVSGTATGYFGEAVPVAAVYLVGSLGAARDVPVSAHVGMTVAQLRMLAPSKVERTVSGSDVTVTAPVAWDWSAVTDASMAEEGTFTVPATAATGFAAQLVVTVVAVEEVNVLREAGVHYTYTHKDDTRFALSDGVRNAVGFADWRSGGAANRVNPNTVSFYFDAPRQVTGAAVYDIGGTKNIGSVTVQYRTLTGGWRDLPAESTTWPATNPTADLSLVVDGDTVLATGVRVAIGNKSTATWMSLSEVEVYGPGTVPAS
ncbi:hypothetical protein J2X85_001841 [Microbacterium trichothecenolyticum]|uniref:Ig-like domain-containing protein n=1 Tax=Microbacterium trichothecenolyticum TaxID=69370 RepID=UPI0028563AC4|nr:Ig-like domain-containing protein [Microbacterium trichothecenolyticum]MDR7184807.1 hypothetical protein [Microbacterium trichothecenolyticum]